MKIAYKDGLIVIPQGWRRVRRNQTIEGEDRFNGKKGWINTVANGMNCGYIMLMAINHQRIYIRRKSKKTAYEKANIWNSIATHSTNLEIAANNQDLSELNKQRHDISKLVSQLERAQVADALSKAKALMKRRKKFIRMINLADSRRLNE